MFDKRPACAYQYNGHKQQCSLHPKTQADTAFIFSFIKLFVSRSNLYSVFKDLL